MSTGTGSRIEWFDHPTMNPRNTRQLRALIERRVLSSLWGKHVWITPRLVSKVFGDGRQLIVLSPIMMRPERFVVRIDSSWSTSNWEREKHNPGDWLDDVLEEIEEEFVEWPWAKKFGLRWTDDDGDDCSSRIDFAGGCEWSEIKWPRERRTKSRPLAKAVRRAIDEAAVTRE